MVHKLFKLRKYLLRSAATQIRDREGSPFSWSELIDDTEVSICFSSHLWYQAMAGGTSKFLWLVTTLGGSGTFKVKQSLKMVYRISCLYTNSSSEVTRRSRIRKYNFQCLRKLKNSGIQKWKSRQPLLIEDEWKWILICFQASYISARIFLLFLMICQWTKSMD